MFRFSCDEDGFMFQANTEQPYPHFFHLLSPDKIVSVRVVGEVMISYIGFGDQGKLWYLPMHSHYSSLSDLQPAPPVGFNLTFMCPEGQVFNHDWFATPFVMMTCQVCL